MLHLLERGSSTVSALAANFAMTLPAVSKHLAILSDAGLLRIRVSRSDRRVKTCELERAGLDEVRRWVEENRGLWNRRLDAMERLLDRRAQRRVR